MYWSAFEAAVEPYGPKILALANPSMPYAQSATKDWPFMHFSQAAAIALAYLGLVLFGLLFRSKPVRGGAGAKEDKLGFLAGVQKEPIKLLALVYNIAQARERRRFK